MMKHNDTTCNDISYSRDMKVLLALYGRQVSHTSLSANIV